MKKLIIVCVVVAMIMGTFTIIESAGLASKKLSFGSNLYDETQTTLNQSEYVVLSNDNILEVEKESVTCFTISSSYTKKVLWQETSYIKYPIIAQSGNLVCVFDKQGYSGIVYDNNGRKYEIKVNLPILEVSINKEGYTAVLQKSDKSSDSKSVITIFDNEGNKLIDRISYEENGGVPITVAMSDNNETFAASYLDVSNNNILSKIIFFKIDGKELKDNLFSSFEYPNTIVTNLKYVDDENVIAVGDNKLIKINLFSEKSNEVEIEDRISEVILDFKDGIVLMCTKNVNQLSSDMTYTAFYNNNLKKKKEQIVYFDANLVSTSKNTLTIGNGSDFHIYSNKGISKCKQSFNLDVKQLLPMNKTNMMLVSTNLGLKVYRLQSATLMSK